MGLAGAIFETLAVLKIVLPVMLLGILASNLLFTSPQVRRVGDLIDRVLPFKCGTVMMSFLAHPIAGLSRLSELYREGAIDDEKLEGIYVLSLLPRSFRVVLMYLAPVAISSFGLTLGVFYTFLELFSRTIPVVLYLSIKRKDLNVSVDYQEFNVRILISRAIKLFLRAASIVVPSIFLVMLALNMGLVDMLRGFLKSIGLPAPSLMIIAVGASSMIACIGVAGSLFDRGVIDPYWLLISIFIASSLHAIVDCFRRGLTLNVSFFGARRGVKLSLISLAMRLSSCAIAILTVNALRLLI